MSEAVAAELPATLRQAVRHELGTALHPPYTAATVVAGNGLLLGAALTIPAWLVGHPYGPRLAGRRVERLTDFLADEERG